MNQEIKTFINERIKKIQKYMNAENIDLVIISSPENVFYFSNFNPIIFSHPVFVVIEKETKLLVHCIRNNHAQDEGALDNIALYGKWGAHISLGMDPISAIKELVGTDKKTVAVECDYMSINIIEKLKTAINICDVKDIGHEIAMLKMIKDAYEINRIKEASELVDIGVGTAIEELSNGNTEAGACTEGQYKMRKLWQEKYPQYEVSGFGSSESAQIDSLVVWSMANERISYGCDCPKNYKPVSGDLVLPMSWGRISGYAAEIERSVIVGTVSDIRMKAYDAMLSARHTVFQIIKPGVLFEDLYKAAMSKFEDAGFGNILPGRCGHGIGLSTHEFPSLTTGNKIALEPGMIFTVEPGLMTKELGGVRHSDTVLVTNNGYEILTKLRNEKIII